MWSSLACLQAAWLVCNLPMLEIEGKVQGYGLDRIEQLAHKTQHLFNARVEPFVKRMLGRSEAR